VDKYVLQVSSIDTSTASTQWEGTTLVHITTSMRESLKEAGGRIWMDRTEMAASFKERRNQEIWKSPWSSRV